jgi:hypothetical protein
VRAPRLDWMTGIESGHRAWPESLMFGLSVVYLVMLLIVIIINLGGQP